MKNTEKTIPFRLSPAELENLRILRRRTNAFRLVQDDEEELTSQENNTRNSDTAWPAKKEEKKIP